VTGRPAGQRFNRRGWYAVRWHSGAGCRPQLGWASQIFYARTDDELNTAFETMAKQKVGAVNVVPDTFFTVRSAHIVALAARYAIPASYYFRGLVIAGGLMSYGADFREPSRVAGVYVGRILKRDESLIG
jgi:putative ABC transport system substrate-binding protein